MDFGTEGLTSPNVLQEINFTSSDFTFLPTNIQILTAGSLITPAFRAQLENAPEVSGTGEIPFRKVHLQDGTIAYLRAEGGAGGDGYGAMMTSKDGRFDMAVAVSAPNNTEFKSTDANRAYYDAMFKDPAATLQKLASAVARIYPTVAANNATVARRLAAQPYGPPSSQMQPVISGIQISPLPASTPVAYRCTHGQFASAMNITRPSTTETNGGASQQTTKRSTSRNRDAEHPCRIRG